MLRSDELDSVYFHVLTRDRRLLAGDKELPAPDAWPGEDLVPGDIYFRDIDYKGQDIRVAYSYLADSAMAPKDWVLVEVGETTEKRTQLANKIVASAANLVRPVAVLNAWADVGALDFRSRLDERIWVIGDVFTFKHFGELLA